MATLEQVEKLRERADVSFEEAKAALDAADGDLLDAMIYLEKQGKVSATGGGYYSSAGQKDAYAGHTVYDDPGPRRKVNGGETFSGMLRRFGRFLVRMIHKGNTNFFEVRKNGDLLITFPVTVLVLLLICFFWITISLIIIGMFFGFRYRFRGEDLGHESINKAIDDAVNAVDDLKKSFGGDERQSL